jgi:hypothetical protein
MDQPVILFQTLVSVAAHLVHNAEDLPADVQEQRVQSLIDLLKQSGDLTPDQAGEAWYEPDSHEHGVVDLFHSGGMTRISLDGAVDQFFGE